MREIFLHCGLVTLISDVDYERCIQHKWRACTSNASGKPYVKTTILGANGRWTTMLMHRMITGCPATMKVDHRDNDGLNNQRPNLRISTFRENNYNRSYFGEVNYKGVDRVKHRFRARIMLDGERTYLGSYTDPVEAAMAYDAAAYKLFGEFAWLNFPENYPAPDYEPVEEDIPF